MSEDKNTNFISNKIAAQLDKKLRPKPELFAKSKLSLNEILELIKNGQLTPNILDSLPAELKAEINDIIGTTSSSNTFQSPTSASSRADTSPGSRTISDIKQQASTPSSSQSKPEKKTETPIIPPNVMEPCPPCEAAPIIPPPVTPPPPVTTTSQPPSVETASKENSPPEKPKGFFESLFGGFTGTAEEIHGQETSPVDRGLTEESKQTSNDAAKPSDNLEEHRGEQEDTNRKNTKRTPFGKSPLDKYK